MKKVALVVFVVALLLTSFSLAFGEEANEKKALSFSGKLGCFSTLIVETTGESMERGGCEPSVTLHNPTGLYISSVGYMTKKELEEVDGYAGYAAEYKGFKFDGGYGFYSISNSAGNLHAFYLSAESPEFFKGVSVNAYFEADVPTSRKALEGGWIWKVGAKKSAPVELKFDVGGNDGAYGTEAKLLSFARAMVSTEFSPFGIKTVPSISFQKGFGGIAEHGWKTVAGLTVALE
jgi:hypothetical protein